MKIHSSLKYSLFGLIISTIMILLVRTIIWLIFYYNANGAFIENFYGIVYVIGFIFIYVFFISLIALTIQYLRIQWRKKNI